MKQLTCEMCGSNDLLKQDGVFVCQSCGTKYSVEEAKKMMVEGTVEVSGTVKVDQSHLIENFLDMAKSAITSGNNSEAEQYCNKVIEIDPNNYKALLYKGTATAWQSTFANIRILETINCWQKASANCEKENRTEFLSYTDAEFRKIVIAMVNLAGSFVENGINDYKGSSYREHLLSILKCVELYTKAINSTFRGDRLCSEAAISVVPCLKKCAQSEERLYHKIKPSSGESYSDFIKEYLGCIDLLNMTATFGQKSAAKALCYQTAAEVMETINDLPFYIWSDGRYIPRQNPRKSYGSTIAEYRSKAAEARAKIEAEKAEEYWQDHPEEHKEFLRKQEEERIRKEKAAREQREQQIKTEKEKRNAMASFWENHADQKLAIENEIIELAKTKQTLLNANSGVEQIKLIDERSRLLDEILNRDRRGKISFAPHELQTLNGQTEFSSKLQKAAHYDSYLDTYPILKEKGAIDAQTRQLNAEKDKLSTLHTDRRFILIGGIVFALLGAIFIFLGSENVLDSGFLTFLAVILLIGGIGMLIGAIYKYYTVGSKKSEINNSLKKLAVKKEKIAKIPAYTEDFDATVVAQQEEKAQKKSKLKKKFAIVGISVLLVLIFIFVLILNIYLIPQQKYDNAMAMMQENRYLEAYVLLDGIKSFKDAQYHMDTMLKSNPMLALSVSQPGDIFEFGHYEQDGNVSNGKEDIEWIVLEVNGNKALLLSKYVIDSQPYHSEYRVDNFKSSNIYSWLQSNFINNAFDSSEISNIVGEISIPSKDQKEQYNIDYKAELTAVAQKNGEQYTVFYPETKRYWTWWLQQSSSNAKSVPLGNGYSTDDIDGKYGVRPIIWVNIGED